MNKYKIEIIDDKILIGRHEWCQLPKLHIPATRAKIDTGAKTSAIHAFNIKQKNLHGKPYVYFDMHPLQHNEEVSISCHAPVVDQRMIISSNGSKELRYVIETSLSMAGHEWNIELTLSSRDQLRFRLLLGREALNKRVLIDPSKTYLLGSIKDPLACYR